MINLISDTVTVPSQEMRAAMMAAPVGDDVFREDPTINQLEEKVAKMFGKEAAIFCPSGTMTNQIAIKVHTDPLDEVICDKTSHVYQYETGGYSFNSGVAINLIDGINGKINAEQINAAIKADYDWLPKSKLVVIENSCNKGGGSYYTLDEIKPIRNLCQGKGLKLHLDGARLFNVLVETKESTQAVGEHFDSISICISKGLGAPVGSLLIGNQIDIAKARRFRKVLGGGMRQAGIIAAGCIYALDHNIERLKIDNDRAKQIAELLAKQSYVKAIRPVKTNILIFDLVQGVTGQEFIDYLKSNDVNAALFGPNTVRFVTHLDFTEAMNEKLEVILRDFKLN